MITFQPGAGYEYDPTEALRPGGQLEEMERRTTCVRWPQSNGFVERTHRTLLDEHFRIKVQEKWYENLD